MSSNADRVEVLAGIQRGRRYSVDQKLAALEEAGQPGMTISYIARRHGISPSLVFGWRRRMAEGGKEGVRAALFQNGRCRTGDDTYLTKIQGQIEHVSMRATSALRLNHL